MSVQGYRTQEGSRLSVLPTVPGKTSGKTSGKILEAILQNNTITIPELSILNGITERSIERNLQKLQKEGTLKRIGPAKGGHWLADLLT